MTARSPGLRARRSRAVGDDEKAVRRQGILAAAKKVFARDGFQATSMADVAKAAHVSYGAVYWYFASKDELFHALMDAEAQALRAHIAEALASSDGEGAEGLLRDAVRATFEFFEADRATVKLLFRDSYALGGRFERHLFGIYEGFIDDLRGVFVEAQRRGEIVDFPPAVAAFSVAALVGQLAHRRLSTDDGLDAGVVADFVVRLLLDGLRPR
ncbi:MAG TPA: TetR family transcriptional regulator [Acidimicrobiales bacterium]|nr:TetR family transcriptional regulator [Acidimicrobiales bacterium]